MEAFVTSESGQSGWGKRSKIQVTMNSFVQDAMKSGANIAKSAVTWILPELDRRLRVKAMNSLMSAVVCKTFTFTPIERQSASLAVLIQKKLNPAWKIFEAALTAVVNYFMIIISKVFCCCLASLV